MIFTMRLPGFGWVELMESERDHFVYRSPFGWRDCTMNEDAIILAG